MVIDQGRCFIAAERPSLSSVTLFLLQLLCEAKSVTAVSQGRLFPSLLPSFLSPSFPSFPVFILPSFFLLMAIEFSLCQLMSGSLIEI